jgi:hypothetical protein
MTCDVPEARLKIRVAASCRLRVGVRKLLIEYECSWAVVRVACPTWEGRFD